MLTEKRIRDLKPEPKTRFVWDRQVANLGVRITSSGVKSYVLFYRVAGKKRLSTIGRCSEFSLLAARARARADLAAVREGTDPVERKRAAKTAPTVAELINIFLTVEGPARIARDRMSPRTLLEYRRQCGSYIEPAIGKLRVVDVKRGDIEKMVALLPPVARNRCLALASRLFTMAETWELRPAGANPCRKIERARETPRDRVLSPDEMAALAGALKEAETESPAAVAVIRFLALTGLRVSEALAIQWEHVDLSSGRLLLPETKTGRRWHDVPATALQLLTSLPRFGPWPFSSTGRAAITYKTVHKVFRGACERAGIADARIHDLRRGVLSAAAASGANVAVLQQLLGHRTPQMALRYARELQDPVQAARESVAERMAAAMAGKSAEVIPLRANDRD